MFDPVTMFAALGPSIIKGVDAAIQRYIVPDKIKPASVADAVALGTVENDKLRILTEADSAGVTYMWVEAIRKLQRPVVVIATLAAFIAHPENAAFAEVFQVIGWWLFGERFMLSTRGIAK